MKIELIKDDKDDVIMFKYGSSLLEMFYTGNGDMYWKFDDFSIPEDQNVGEFYISKQDNEIYEAFDNLYKRIQKCVIFKISAYQIVNIKNDEEFDMLKEKRYLANKLLRNSIIYNKLFDGKTITWRSDDDSKGESLSIEKIGESYKLTFKKMEKDSEESYSLQKGLHVNIKFKKDKSRYEPFNGLFMNTFNDLYKYEQIHRLVKLY